MWLLYKEVNIFLMVCMMFFRLMMFRKVFCWLVKEVFGKFLVVVDECMVKDMLVVELVIRCWYCLVMVMVRFIGKGVLIIYWWICVL